ncbi:hypothetical protein M6B38_115625 [Iris pallida]|uniref:Uncharacterized protein n=1 Tax=Iris pallida TaxID=29817 RepID=A0AAX6I4V7_IRIPA|nr:hypothetical protein M6B38_115625 [Iris pallida]
MVLSTLERTNPAEKSEKKGKKEKSKRRRSPKELGRARPRVPSMPTRTRQLRVATSSMAVLHRNLNHDGVADNHRGGRRSHGEAGRPVEEEDEVRWPPCSVVGKRQRSYREKNRRGRHMEVVRA